MDRDDHKSSICFNWLFHFNLLKFSFPPSPSLSSYFSLQFRLSTKPHISATMLITSIALLAWSLCASVVYGQDGAVTGPTSSAQAAGYSCDTSKCQLPNCNCASTSPPGGLSPVSLAFSNDNVVLLRISLDLGESTVGSNIRRDGS